MMYQKPPGLGEPRYGNNQMQQTSSRLPMMSSEPSSNYFSQGSGNMMRPAGTPKHSSGGASSGYQGSMTPRGGGEPGRFMFRRDELDSSRFMERGGEVLLPNEIRIRANGYFSG
jgi:hypothetical protein